MRTMFRSPLPLSPGIPCRKSHRACPRWRRQGGCQYALDEIITPARWAQSFLTRACASRENTLRDDDVGSFYPLACHNPPTETAPPPHPPFPNPLPTLCRRTLLLPPPPRAPSPQSGVSSPCPPVRESLRRSPSAQGRSVTQMLVAMGPSWCARLNASQASFGPLSQVIASRLSSRRRIPVDGVYS